MNNSTIENTDNIYINNIIQKCVGGEISIYLIKDSITKELKKIKHGKLNGFSIKDNIMCFEFENSLCKHDNNFYMPLPYKLSTAGPLFGCEIHLSYKSKDLLEYMDADDLLDLEEQNTGKSPLYNKDIVIKWS